MRNILVRTAVFAVGTSLTILLSGCTLSGAEPATTPVGGDTGSLPITQEATQQQLPPTPTPIGPIDVFATQTAQAAAATAIPTQTIEPGGLVTIEPTQSLITPTPVVSTTPGTTTGGTGTCPATYTVQQGDNLFRIAMKFGIDWHDLAAANGITNPESLQVGQVLTIPGCQGQGSGTGTGTGTGTPSGSEETYVVQAGDNLFRIALKYGITWQELAAYNNITDPTSIYPGQVLKIPPH
jgi:peptidoglycan-N-acetylglucosamine deacetylase